MGIKSPSFFNIFTNFYDKLILFYQVNLSGELKFVFSLYRLALWCPPILQPWVLCGRNHNWCKWAYALLHSTITEISDAKEGEQIKPKSSYSPKWKCNTYSSITVQLEPLCLLSSLNVEKVFSGERRVLVRDRFGVDIKSDKIKWVVEVCRDCLARNMSEGMHMF